MNLYSYRLDCRFFRVFQKVSFTSIDACLRSQLLCQTARCLGIGTQIFAKFHALYQHALGSNSGAGWICYAPWIWRDLRMCNWQSEHVGHGLARTDFFFGLRSQGVAKVPFAKPRVGGSLPLCCGQHPTSTFRADSCNKIGRKIGN